MKYRLVVTTDGRPGYLEKMLASFDEAVRPRPAETLIVDDSGDEHYQRYLRVLLDGRGHPYRLSCHPARQGFCRTVGDAWCLGSEPGPPWVYWSEDDFVYDRAVNLGDLAAVLDHEANVAQMGLMRQPVNGDEIAAGSLFALYRESYELRGAGNRKWMESRTNFSTTSSLLRRRFMVERPWPLYEDGCEGRYSIDLLQAGYRFAVWGHGDEWVQHFGARSGTGY